MLLEDINKNNNNLFTTITALIIFLMCGFIALSIYYLSLQYNSCGLVKALERTNEKYSSKTYLNSDWFATYTIVIILSKKFEYPLCCNFSMASLSLRVLQQRKNNLNLERKNIDKFQNRKEYLWYNDACNALILQIMCTIVATLDAPTCCILGERQVNK
ncbi:huntingtin-interacting protein 1 isoform X1 [Vespula squamosa]|uniref:Huntingtin-interacting protein 1 isoform X1 n=1 Tax=Vespula squamosa TaxID=30214 RepID=A0ABD2AQI8_VESSQ